jgi:YggT family protein
MMGEILRFLLDIVFNLVGAVLLGRAWIHAAKLHPFNPMSQAIYQATNWLVQPLRKIVPTSGGLFDWASLARSFACRCSVLAVDVVSFHGKHVARQASPRALRCKYCYSWTLGTESNRLDDPYSSCAVLG